MPEFAYKAIDQLGKSVAGTITADTPEIAAAILANQGVIPSKVVEKSDTDLSNIVQTINAMLAKVRPEELILFTKQFRTMLSAGIPIIQVMEILSNQTQNKKLKKAIAAIGADLKSGESITGAFGRHPDIFESLYVNMLRAGEVSGTLPEVLKRLIYILDHEHKIKSDIKTALAYPKLVVIALGAAFLILLTFVIPKFAGIFMRAGITLPLPTRICIVLNAFIMKYWYIIIAVVAIAIFLYRNYVKTSQGRFNRDKLILDIPIIGPLFIKAAMSRFASIFAILQASGIQVLSSLQILSGTIGNEAIAREFDRIKDKVQEGRGISGPLKSAKYFPPMVVDMVAIGEETGQLDEMLQNVSVHYDDEVEYAVKRLSDHIGPILVVGLAVVVGFFALAIYLPMWDLAKIVR